MRVTSAGVTSSTDWPSNRLPFGRGLFDDAGENHIGQQADVFGEQAEYDPVEEMGHLAGVEGPGAHGIGDAGEVLRRLLGYGGAGLAGFQLLGVEKDVVEDLQVARLAKFFEGDFVGDGDGAGEVGADDNAVHVTDHEQRRVADRVFVEEQLIEGGSQVFVLALVFGFEEALLPDIGEAVAATVLGGAFLETERRAGWIGLGRRGMADEAAQVYEMLLGGGALLEVRLFPLGYELGHIHGGDPLGLGREYRRSGRGLPEQVNSEQ